MVVVVASQAFVRKDLEEFLRPSQDITPPVPVPPHASLNVMTPALGLFYCFIKDMPMVDGRTLLGCCENSLTSEHL